MQDVKLTVCFDESLQSRIAPARVFGTAALHVSKQRRFEGIGCN